LVGGYVIDLTDVRFECVHRMHLVHGRVERRASVSTVTNVPDPYSLFVLYITTLLISQNVRRKIIGRMGKDMEGNSPSLIWSYYPGTCSGD
jgi:hypothetical protein